MADELVRMERINKYFGRVQALNDVTLSVRKNEIVGLLGDNGAGKSTLIKILSGALRPDSGEIYMHGTKVKMRTTTDAIARGIETIYQDSALVVQLSIARNLFLGREPVKRPRLFDRLDQTSDERGRSPSYLSRLASLRISRRRLQSVRYPAASARRLRLRERCISKVN